MYPKYFLTFLFTLFAVNASAQKLDLVPEDRRAEPIVAPASNEAELALQIIDVPDDLDVNLWAAEPMLVNPVAFDIDEKGRVFVSETHRYRSSVLDIRHYMDMLELDLASRTIEDRAALIEYVFEEEADQFKIESEVIRLVEDTDGDGKADSSKVFADGFNDPLSGIASGVLARNGKVWFTEIPGLWLLEEGDKPGTVAKRTEILRGFGVHFGYTGHDLHGLIFGPDGKLYFSIGDRGAYLVTKEGNEINLPDEGAVFRCDPDGSNLEVFARGLRNPQELAFDEYGNLWTFDNDCDMGDSERMVYIAEGSDAGWRVGYQYSLLGNGGPWIMENMWQPRHEGQPEYIIPTLANIEDGPSGVAYYPGTGLHPRYKGHFFVCQFRGSIASSGIYTYTVKPDGASFELDQKELFLKGVLPTDVTFAPDGKFYVSDWTPGWPKSTKGRIYTVSHAGTLETDLVQDTEVLIEEGMGSRSTHELLKLLSYPDWRVRLEAQFELVRQKADPKFLHQVATSGEEDAYSQMHATWALGQMTPKNPQAAKYVLDLAKTGSPEVRGQALKLIGDHGLEAGYPSLMAGLDHASDRVKFFAAQSLGKLGNSDAAEALIGLLLVNNDRDVYLRHAAIMGLVGTANQRILTNASKSPYRSVRLGALLTYRRLEDPAVAQFLNDSDITLVQEAARAIIGANISRAFPALAALSSSAESLDHMLGLRILNAHFRMGKTENANALAQFAAQPNASDALRAEALVHLAQWENPPARDRVIGLYRPLPSRSSEAAENALSSVFTELLDAPEMVQAAAINTASRLNQRNLTKDLFSKFQNNKTPSAVRIAILNTLSKMDDPKVEEAARIASESSDQALRLATLPVIAKISPDASASMLKHLVETGKAIEQQAAFQALGTMNHPVANKTLISSLTKLGNGDIPVKAQLELLEAAEAVNHPEVRAALQSYQQSVQQSVDPLAPYTFSLEGGDVDNGRAVFEKNKITPCIRCHVSDGAYTGEPGPSLYGIASRVDAEYLLSSIVEPSKDMAPGFEMAIVTTQSGDILAGFVSEETEDGLSLRLPDGSQKSVAKAEIATKQSAPSTMPAIYANSLSKRDLRDLIAFLGSLVDDRVKGDKEIEEYH